MIVDGVNLSGLKEKELAVFRRNKVGFVYQNFNLVPTLTIKENILFPLSLAGSTPDQRFCRCRAAASVGGTAECLSP